MSFSHKKVTLLVLLAVTLGVAGCATGNPVADRQIFRRQTNMARTWDVAVRQEQRRGANLARTEDLARRQLERRIERFHKLAHNWMIWAAFI